MLPNPNNRNPSKMKGAGYLPVALEIPLNLCLPEGCILFWRLKAPRASMPKTSVNENGYPQL
jgi:hypothetical protein